MSMLKHIELALIAVGVFGMACFGIWQVGQIGYERGYNQAYNNGAEWVMHNTGPSISLPMTGVPPGTTIQCREYIGMPLDECARPRTDITIMPKPKPDTEPVSPPPPGTILPTFKTGPTP